MGQMLFIKGGRESESARVYARCGLELDFEGIEYTLWCTLSLWDYE